MAYVVVLDQYETAGEQTGDAVQTLDFVKGGRDEGETLEGVSEAWGCQSSEGGAEGMAEVVGGRFLKVRGQKGSASVDWRASEHEGEPVPPRKW